jgi:hypothetical protein
MRGTAWQRLGGGLARGAGTCVSRNGTVRRNVTSALAAALEQRGAQAATAALLAPVGTAIFRAAFDRWAEQPERTSLAGRIRETAAELAASIQPAARRAATPADQQPSGRPDPAEPGLLPDGQADNGAQRHPRHGPGAQGTSTGLRWLTGAAGPDGRHSSALQLEPGKRTAYPRSASRPARRVDRWRYSNGSTRRSFGRPADSLERITSARSATMTSTSPTRRRRAFTASCAYPPGKPDGWKEISNSPSAQTRFHTSAAASNEASWLMAGRPAPPQCGSARQGR